MASTEDDVVVRLRLKDVARFIADVKSGKLAIEDLEKEVSKAGRTSARESSSSGGFGKLASHFGFLKYAAFGAVGSLAAAAGGVATYAVKSAASLEQVTIAFTTMLGSAKAARSMVGSLQTFAQRTPFDLSDVQAATQHLLAFKFSAQSIIPTLTSVGDAVSGLNLGPEGFQRIILALGQMKAVSTVQGGEVLQLEQAGVNVRSYLEKALHLTPQQLASAMRTNSISANTAIPIILRGMEAQFKGMMNAESGTLGGMWSNFHDAIQQGLIKLANPFMPAMKKWLGEVTNYLGGPDGKSGLFARAAKFMAVLPGNITSGRAGFAAYNIGAILGTHKFDPAIEKGVRVVHNLGVIVKDVLVPSLKDLSIILAPVVLVLDHLDQITGVVADHSTAFRVVVDILAGSFLAYRGAVFAVNGMLKLQAFWTRVVTGATKAWTAAQWLLNFAMDANPIGLIALGIAAIAAGIYIAYTHSETFRRGVQWLWDKLQDLGGWIKKNWKGIVGFLLDPFQAVLDTWHGLQAAWQWFTGQNPGSPGSGYAAPPVGANGAASGASTVPGHGMGPVPGHALGGIMTRTHSAWVGERGPELLTLPRGSSVIPLPRVPEFAGRGPIHVHVMVDKREIAQAVYDDMGDRVARR